MARNPLDEMAHRPISWGLRRVEHSYYIDYRTRRRENISKPFVDNLIKLGSTWPKCIGSRALIQAFEAARDSSPGAHKRRAFSWRMAQMSGKRKCSTKLTGIVISCM